MIAFKNIQVWRKYFSSFSSEYSYPILMWTAGQKFRVLVIWVVKEKNLEASIPFVQSPFLNNPCFWDTRTGAGCWAFAYSSQLLLARPWTQQHWAAGANSATFLADSSFLGLFLWYFLIPLPPASCNNIKWKPLFGVVTDSGFLMELQFFSSAWKVNATLTSFKQRLSFIYDNSINAYT